MRIGLDVRMLDNSGIGTTIKALLSNLPPEKLEQFVLFGPPSTANRYPCEWKQVNDSIYGILQHLRYGRFLNHQDLTLFHMPHFDVPCGYNGKLLVTVFDLIHVLFPEYSTKPFSKTYALWRLSHVAKNAQRIIVPSENTRADLLRFFPTIDSKISVCSLAVDESFKPASTKNIEDVLSTYNLQTGYFFYLGNIRPSKNSERLLRAYHQLRVDRPDAPPLVMSGSISAPLKNKVAGNNGVRYLGSVPSEHLNALYSGALAFVFPSFYEGFGLPPLEAMACGTPVIASHVASLPEVCGDAALYVDPHSDGDLIEAMKKMLDSSSLRNDFVQKGFANVKRTSWKQFAQKNWEIYESIS